MKMNDGNKTLASTALVNLVNNELVCSSKRLRLRYISYFCCVLAAFTVYYSYVWPLREPVMESPPSGLSVPAMMRFADHQDAIYMHTMMIHMLLLSLGPSIVQIIAVPLALNLSATAFCTQLEQMAQLSLNALNQPESTAVRVKSILRYRSKATKLKVDSWFSVDGIRKQKGEVITSMMDAISTQHRGQLGPQATELMSKLLLELEYVQYDPSHTKVALSILGALYRAGDSRAIPAVKTVLKRTNNPSMRLAAQQTLEALEEQRVGSENLLHVTDEHGTDTLLRVGAVDTTTHVDLLRPSISTTEDVVHSTPTVIPTASRDEEKIELSNRAG
jgi:hypothetical protein